MSLLAAGALALVGAALGWWPLASWAERSMRTPAVDRMRPRTVRVLAAASTALSFALVTWRLWPSWLLLLALLAFCTVAVVLAIVDLAERRLPNTVILAGVVSVAGVVLLAAMLTGNWTRPLWALAGAAAMFAAYFLLALISPAAMGMGDVKLAFLIGLVLGWFGLTVWLLGLLAGFVIGGVAAVIALARRRVSLKGSLPFGPSMLAGVVVALLLLG